MARIRSIKPEFFTSESVAELPIRARLTWIGLWTECDDHGVTRDNPRLIKGHIWPLDSVTLGQVETDLRILHDAGRIVRFMCGRRKYLAVTSWDEHQKMSRKGRNRYPTLDAADCVWNGNEYVDADQCSTEDALQVQGDLSLKQGTGNREQGTREGDDSDESSVTFDDFWKHYPRKLNRGAAKKAWMAAVKKANPADIIAAVSEYATLVAGKDPQFIPHGSTWLNGERWSDEEETGPPEPKRVTAAELEEPPDGLTPEEYSRWLAERRAG